MEGQSLQESLLSAIQRLAVAEQELQLAMDEFRTIYNRIAGKVPTSGPGTATIIAAEDRPAPVRLHAAQIVSTLTSTLNLHDRRSSIRARLREFAGHNRGRCLSAAAIAEALGIKKSSTRFELYQLQKEGIVKKRGVDQWQFPDSGKDEEHRTEPQGVVDAPKELASGTAPVAVSGTVTPLDRNTEATTVLNAVEAPSKPRGEISGTSGVTKPEIAEEEVTLSDAAIASEWYSTRERILQYLQENSFLAFTTEQITTKLKINRSLAQKG